MWLNEEEEPYGACGAIIIFCVHKIKLLSNYSQFLIPTLKRCLGCA